MSAERVATGPIRAVAVVAAVALATAIGPLATGAIAVAAASAGSPVGDRSILFVPNVGQFDRTVRFQARGGGAVAWVTRDALVLSRVDDAVPGPASREPTLWPGSPSSPPRPRARHGVSLRLTLVGMGPEASPVGADRRPTEVNYLLGADRSRWRTAVPTFGSVRWPAAYPGVSLALGGEDGRLAIRVDGGGVAGLTRVRIRIEGARAVVSADGSLVARTAVGDVELPQVLFDGDGTVPSIRGSTASFAPRSAAVPTGTRPAGAIEPPRTRLLLGTFLGGADDDYGSEVATGPDGSIFVAGQTLSNDFPTSPGAFDTSYNSGSFGGDVFVSKLDPTGSTLIYSTFLGGSDTDAVSAIAVGSEGGVVVAGYTYAQDFPTTARAFEPAFGGGCCDGFVTKLNASGRKLVYSTFLGGDSFDQVTGMALGADRSVYVTGETLSADFPTAPSAFDGTINEDGDELYADAFVARLDTKARALLAGSFLGGKYNDAAEAIAVNASGSAYVAGVTQSPNFPTTRKAFDRSFNGGGSGDAFVTRIGAGAFGLRFSTFLGGGDDDEARAIAVGANGSVYAVGITSSPDFPVSTGAFDTSLNSFPFSDVFATELDARGRSLSYGTFLGGGDSDIAGDVALGTDGSLTIVGTTYSDDFPTTHGALDRALGGPADVLVSRLDPTGSSLVFSTFLGGTGAVIDSGLSVALVGPREVYVSGSTHSDDFPTTPGAFDTSFDGGFDAFACLLHLPS